MIDHAAGKELRRLPKSLRYRYGLRSAHSTDPHGEFSLDSQVRGHAKVFLHLAFGILAIAVEQVFELLE